jgi:PAS domain S-box-containing protein
MPPDLHRILLVEDDLGLSELIREGLTRAGLHCDLVTSGRACLDWLAAQSADLLLLDYSLPDMTGAALLGELQQRSVPPPEFVVITGRGDEEVAVQLMKLGALDYLVKDARLLGRLPDTIRRLLGEVATRRRLAAAEQALQESEQRYRHLLTSITDYIYSVRIEAGRPGTTSHGPGCVAVTGYTPEEYAASPWLWFDMVHPEDRAAVEAHARAAITGEMPGPIENRIIHKDGSLRWVQNTMVPRRDAGGRLIACDGIVTDITKRKQADAALRESERHYRLLFESNPMPMWVYDRETLAFLAVNEAAIIHYGYTHDEFMAMTIRDIRPQADAPKLLATVAQATQGVHRSGHWRHRKKDGTLIDVDITSHSLRFSDRDARLVLAVDITEATRSETALRARNDELTRFNRAATGRELRMIELKREVNELCRELGRPPAYALDFTTPPPARPPVVTPATPG